MALDDVFNVVHPNAINGVDTTAADKRALVIEEFTGMVEGTLDRRSLMKGQVPVRSVQGTDTFTNHAVGESTLGKVTPGVTPDGTKNDFSKNNPVIIDTVVNARAVLGLLEPFQTQMNVRQEIATEHGKKIAKFFDQTMLIQAAKASLLTESTFARGSAGKPAGHSGGSQETLALAGDLLDPAKLYAALARLMVKMEKKDVDPRNDDVFIVVRPDEYYTLIQAEQLVNASYVTATGNQVNNGWVLKTYGVPVYSTNNAPFLQNITGHLMSNAGNGNAYDGDFSKLAAMAFSTRAIMAGETIPLQTDVFYERKEKCWFVDAHLSFGVGPNRAEYAGAILLP